MSSKRAGFDTSKPSPIGQQAYHRTSQTHYYLCLPDLSAGRKDRFTVYEIRFWGDKAAQIIGRELPVGECKRLVARRLKVVA